jgi:hypothetical protein
LSRFAPVYLPAGRELEWRASMTMLRHYERCPRAGYLYQLHKGSFQNVNMARGTAFHEVAERAVRLMVEQNERSIPPELVKAIVNEVLAEHHVVWTEQDKLREMAYRWASDFTLRPEKVIACETLVVLKVGRWQVRCKVDFAEGTGLIVRVEDWKSSRAAPGYEEVARKREEGPHHGVWTAKNFQLVIYALALAYGNPVRYEVFDGDDGTSGYQEIIEDRRLAPQAEQFDLAFVFPAIENLEGKMVRRSVTLTRLELGEYYESLVALLGRLERSELEGDWPAILSDDACKECPARRECPIPRELRDHAGEINTLEDAIEAAEVLDRHGDENSALRKELKLWAKARDVEIPFGANKLWRFVYSSSERVDKDGLFAAIAGGEHVDRARFVKVVESTNFTAVTLSDDELADRREKEQHA